MSVKGIGKWPMQSALMKLSSQLYKPVSHGNASTAENAAFVDFYLATFNPAWAVNAATIIGGGTPC